MMVLLDARIPLRFDALDTRQADEAVVTDGLRAAAPVAFFEPAVAAHEVDCACCVARGGAATALGQLFRDRAIGTGRPFRSVLAVVGPTGEAEIRAALLSDPLASARYRLVA